MFTQDEETKKFIKEVVLEALEEFFLENSSISKINPTRCWYPTKEAWKLIGLKNSRQLLEMKSRFKLGTHYRISNRQKFFNRPTYDWHVPNCLKFLSGEKHRY